MISKTLNYFCSYRFLRRREDFPIRRYWNTPSRRTSRVERSRWADWWAHTCCPCRWWSPSRRLWRPWTRARSCRCPRRCDTRRPDSSTRSWCSREQSLCPRHSNTHPLTEKINLRDNQEKFYSGMFWGAFYRCLKSILNTVAESHVSLSALLRGDLIERVVD